MCLNFRSTCMYCHVTYTKSACLHCCPTCTMTMKTHFCAKKEEYPEKCRGTRGGSCAQRFSGNRRGGYNSPHRSGEGGVLNAKKRLLMYVHPRNASRRQSCTAPQYFKSSTNPLLRIPACRHTYNQVHGQSHHMPPVMCCLHIPGSICADTVQICNTCNRNEHH